MRRLRRWHKLLLVTLAASVAGILAVGYQQARSEGEYQTPGAGFELVHNGGFESAQGEKRPPELPAEWIQDRAKTGKKGTVSLDTLRFHSGGVSLRLEPNSKNGGIFPLAVAQVIPGGPWRGQDVEVSGHVLVRGGAIANLGMLNFIGKQGSNLVSFSKGGTGEGWVRLAGIYHVPGDASVRLVVTCFAQGTSGTAWFDDISVRPVSGMQPTGSPIPTPAPAPPSDTADPKAMKASVAVDASQILREIPRTLYGTNVEWIWNGNLLWDAKTQQPDRELVRLTVELGVSLIRYPGGHFSDFYHWKDAIGPVANRREIVHEPGKGDKSRPEFGTDEALHFAKLVNGELLITVNAGTGTPQEAADWVRYVNGGGRRVRYWEIGNELYTKDSTPISKASATGPETYAARVRQFAQAMRAADPTIRVGAIGGENQGLYKTVTYKDWDRIVLERAGDQIDFLAVHNAYAPIVMGPDEKKDVRTVYSAMLAAPRLIARNLDTVSKQIEQYAPAHAARIKIAVTEWSPVFQFDAHSRYVDHVKTLGSALFAASTLKAFIESPRTDMANFFLLNDLSVLGWIGSKSGDFPPHPQWAPTARYLVFQLFTAHFGERLVHTGVDAQTFKSENVGFTAAVTGVPYLDAVSSLSKDGQRLYVIAVNKHFDQGIDAAVSIRGFRPAAQGNAWAVTGTSIDSNTGTTVLRIPGLRWARQAEEPVNPRFSRGSSADVTMASIPVSGLGSSFTWKLPPHSVTSLVMTRAGTGR